MATGEEQKKAGTRAHPWALTILALAAALSWGIWAWLGPNDSMGREDAVKWLTPENAPAPAQSPKPVLYEFSADWCPPCQKLRQQVFCDGKAAAEIQTLYIPVQVLDRRQEEGKNPPKTEELQKQYAIQAFPTLVVAYPDGRPPKTASGYENKESVMAFLEDAARMDGNTPAPATGAQTKQRTGK